jgi:hypothetical protein
MIKLDLPSLQVRPSPPFRGKDAALGQGLRAGAVMLLFLILLVSLWRTPARAEPAPVSSYLAVVTAPGQQAQ